MLAPKKSKSPKSITKYFTFGQGHKHMILVGAVFEVFDKDSVVKITAPNPEKVMFSYFANEWALAYDNRPNVEKYYPRGIYDMNLKKWI